MPSPNRTDRISDVIQKEIATLLRTEARDPRFLNITITAAKVTPDLSSARIYFTLLEKKELDATLQALKKAAGFLRHQLAQRINLRKTPALQFTYDEELIKGQDLSDLISKIE